MTVNVGSVAVRVVPDARGFDRDLRRQLSDLPDERVRVTPDTTGFRERVRQTSSSSGEESGGVLAQGMRQGFMRQSPLIAAAIAGAISAGAPTVIAGTTVLFGAIGALAVKSNAQVKAAWTALGADIKATAAADAASLVPIYSHMANQIDSAFQDLSPEIASAFQAVGPLMESFTGSVLKAAQVAMPGLVNAVKQARPVMDGLDTVMVDIGQGLDGFLNAISAHAGAAGTALSSIGSILKTALPALGTLLGEGAELATAVLPPLASALGLVGRALDVIAPALPAVVGGLVGMKVAALLVGPMAVLAQNLAFASYSGGAFASSAGLASRAASGLGAALPLIAVGVGVVVAALPSLINLLHEGSGASDEAKAQTQSLTTALQASRGAIDANIRSMQLQKAASDGVLDYAKKAGVSLPLVTQALTGNKGALDQVNTALQNYINKHPGGIHDKEASGAKNAKNSLNDLAAALGLATHQTALMNGAEQGVTAATHGATAAAQSNADRLQGIADKASAASTQINILKGALDALTGKQVSEMQAQVQVTQAVNAATSSLKGMHGALVDANGQINLNTQAGAAAFQSLTTLAGADNTYIATMEQHGATTDKVRAKDAQLRDQFIHTAEQMGFTAGQAQDLANKILGIPDKRNVEITADTSPAAGSLNALIGKFQTVNFGTALHARAFAEGGYTGPGGKYTPAGIVHAGEFVMPKESVDRLGVGFLGSLAGLRGYANGGPVGYAGGGLVGNSSLMRYLVELTSAGASQFNAGLERALGSIAGAFGGGSGSSRWAGIVAQVVRMLGLPAAAISGILGIIQSESGGNPNAINLWDCVTLDTVILTRSGWKKHDEVQIGDETIGYNPKTGRSEWTRITRVVHYEDAPLVRLGNSRWHATTTPNHRWVNLPRVAEPKAPVVGDSCHLCSWPEGTRRRGATTRGGLRIHLAKAHGIKADAQRSTHATEASFVTTEQVRSRDRLLLAAEADTGEGLPITDTEAAILGWLAGDGHIEEGRRGKSMSIAQSKPALVAKLRDLLKDSEVAVYVDERLTRTGKQACGPRHQFRFTPAYRRDLLARVGHPKHDAETIVLKMSATQRRAWLGAFIDAEGHRDGGHIRLDQAYGPVLNAAHLAAYLCGHRPRLIDNKVTTPGWSPTAHISLGRPVVSGGFLTKEDAGRGDVWCVTTDLGSWTAEQDGQVFLTGNSNARAGHPSQGLMQTIPSTFYAWAGPFASRGITDPLANVYAGTNYALHTYGLGMLEGGGRHSGGRYIGYDQGGTLDPGYHLVYNGTGQQELIAPKQTFMQAMSGASGAGTGPASFVGDLYLDSGEFLGKVRGEAQAVTDSRLQELHRKVAVR